MSSPVLASGWPSDSEFTVHTLQLTVVTCFIIRPCCHSPSATLTMHCESERETYRRSRKPRYMFKPCESPFTSVFATESGHTVYLFFWCHFLTLLTFTVIGYVLDPETLVEDAVFMREQFATFHYLIAAWVTIHAIVIGLIYPLAKLSAFHSLSLVVIGLIVLAGIIVAPIFLRFHVDMPFLVSLILIVEQLRITMKVISFLAEKRRIKNKKSHQIAKTFAKSRYSSSYSLDNSGTCRPEKQGNTCISLTKINSTLSVARDGKSDSFYLSEGSFETLCYNDKEQQAPPEASPAEGEDAAVRSGCGVTDGSLWSKKYLSRKTAGERGGKKERKATGIFESMGSVDTGNASEGAVAKAESQADELASPAPSGSRGSECEEAYLASPECEDEETLDRGLLHLVYFLFAPTLIYSERYPRSEHPIRWARAAGYLGEFMAFCFAGLQFTTRSSLPWARTIGLQAYTIFEYIQDYYKIHYALILIYLGLGYGFLHAWLNGWAEVLRFADRRFYGKWWLARDVREYSRSWNYIIGAWTVRYIYRPVFILTNSRFLAITGIFVLSALFHELATGVAMKLIFPVLAVSVVTAQFARIMPSNMATHTVSCLLINTLGMAILGSTCYLYAIEYHSRQNCPSNATLFFRTVDFLTPRFISCVKIKLSDESVVQGIGGLFP